MEENKTEGNKKKKNFSIYFLVILLLISIEVGYIIGNKFIKKTSKPAKKEKELKIGAMKDLEEMILTLNTKSRETKYCKILITLEFKDEKKIQDVEKLAPLLYDKIIKIADRYYVEELLTDPGKESFRNEIKREFSSILGTDEFNIYFKRFIL